VTTRAKLVATRDTSLFKGLQVLPNGGKFPFASPRDQIRESIMILLTMGLKSDHFLDQPFKTQNQFQNHQSSLSNS
jgi:hypothetical protein